MPNDCLTDLRCEYLANPIGIDEPRPRLSWVQQSDRRGAKQLAYRVQVARSMDLLRAGQADLWDSGRVDCDRANHVEYAGKPLTSRTRCYWQVSVWDERGEVLLSEPASWAMGLLTPEDWQSSWITHDPQILQRDEQAITPTSITPGTPAQFRKAFATSQKVLRATLYCTARGVVEPRMNGQRVTQDQFVPEWTDYHKRLHYRTYNVTALVHQGENAIAATVGDGWWSGYIGWQETRGQYGTLVNSLLMQLELELADGQTVVVVTDPTWRCDTGPILASDFMLGETYDARREQSGWDQPGFDDTQWLPALTIDPPTVRVPKFGFSENQPRDTTEPLPLVAQRSEPVQVVEALQPISVATVSPGVHVYDFGQNFAGWVELSISGAAGTRLQLRHAERLNPDGTVYTENLRRADATDVYVLSGNGTETWQPRFTFHGFQYLELTGVEQPLPVEAVRGCVLMSATPPAGEFECSHPLVNRLWKNALWGQKSNFLTVPTDCPQRDERLGWMGDAQIFMRTATYNMDVAAFFTKWMTDVIDSQDEGGVFPDVAPRIDEGDNFIGLDGLGGAAGWADAGIVVPWTMWRVYGDLRIVERSWDAMNAWLDCLERNNPEFIREHQLNNNYGDWLCIPADTTFRTHSEMKTLLATAYWADDAAKLAQMARALGREAEAQQLEAVFAKVRSAFQQRWLQGNGRLEVETQTSYLLALAFNLLPVDQRAPAAQRLVELIEATGGNLSTGFIGIKQLNPVLTEVGRADIAGRLLVNEEYPSWLYPVKHGATTIWERWNGWTADDGFFNPQMNSFNHYSLGSVSEWLYSHLAGIQLDEFSPGFKQFVIKPYPTAGLSHAGASYRSIHGKIESRWQQSTGEFKLRVQIPPNTQATVCCPAAEGVEITESNRSVEEAEGVEPLGSTDGYTKFLVQPGKYEFVARCCTGT